jgi:hypothetical protein
MVNIAQVHRASNKRDVFAIGFNTIFENRSEARRGEADFCRSEARRVRLFEIDLEARRGEVEH